MQGWAVALGSVMEAERSGKGVRQSYCMIPSLIPRTSARSRAASEFSRVTMVGAVCLRLIWCGPFWSEGGVALPEPTLLSVGMATLVVCTQYKAAIPNLLRNAVQISLPRNLLHNSTLCSRKRRLPWQLVYRGSVGSYE